MLISTEKLDAPQIEMLEMLSKVCQKHDGDHIAFYPELLAHFRPKPSTLLYYHQEQLIAFAAAFFFENDTTELSILVHPEHRHQGIGKMLISTLLSSIEISRPCHQITCAVPHHLPTQWLKDRHLNYQNSEYEMAWDSHQQRPSLPDTLHVRQGTFHDMDILCDLDRQCFPHNALLSQERFRRILSKDNHVIYLLYNEQGMIGKAHMSREKKGARLSDIAIFPAMQRQGYGQHMVSFCIQEAQAQGLAPITLSVETHNQHALNLYLHLGFQIINAIDYWGCSFSHLKTLFKI